MNIVNKNLTEKQYALVDTLVATGCSITHAAQVAGYAKGEAGRVSASKALKLPHVQQYMMQRVGETIGLNATVAAAKVLELASHPADQKTLPFERWRISSVKQQRRSKCLPRPRYT